MRGHELISIEKLGGDTFFYIYIYILFCQYGKKRGLISYCAGRANVSVVCLKILLNLYKKE